MKYRIRSADIKLFLLVLTIAIVGKGCECSCPGLLQTAGVAAGNRKAQFVYIGTLPATNKLVPAITVALKSLYNDSQGVLFVGAVHFKGKITPQAAGSAIPTKVRFLLKHKAAAGKVLATITYDVNVQSDGTILMQNFPFNQFTLIDPKETLEYTFLPVDANLPASNVNLNFSVTPAGAELVDDESPQEANATVQREQFQFVGLVGDVQKNKTIGPFSLKFVKGPLGLVNGSLHVKGKLTNDPGTTLPPSVRVTVKHMDPTGKLLSTDNMTVQIQSNGTIALQTFPFTTTNTLGVSETLVVSMVSPEKPFPFSSVNVTLSFTPST